MFSLPGLQPGIQAYGEVLLDWANQAGAAPRVTSAYRTAAQQARLYRRYLAGLSPYPALPPGYSKHQAGRAFDVVTNNDAYWLPIMGAVWKSWGGGWSPSDPIHFEV